MWRVKKRCPECGAAIYNKCCTKCGYIKDGVKVKLEYSPVDEDLFSYSTDYSSMFTNENSILPFIFGFTYLAWAGHFVLGMIGALINYLIFFYSAAGIRDFLFNIGVPEHYITIWWIVLLIIFLVIIRYIESIFLNIICLQLDKIKYEHIKKKYNEKYKMHLNRLNGKKAIFLVYVFWIIILIIWIIIYRFLKGNL